MRFTYCPSREEVEQYYGTDETMMMLVSFDGESAVIAPAIETVEHHTLLAQAGIRETEIDRYFRIVGLPGHHRQAEAHRRVLQGWLPVHLPGAGGDRLSGGAAHPQAVPPAF